MENLMQNFETFTATSMTRSEPRSKEYADFGKVAVLLGGRSAERAVSLQSGQNVLAALLRQGVDAYGLDPDQHLAQRLIADKYARVFVVLHGKEGEDGVIQGLLQMLDLPYTGSGVAASALAMDKARAKLVMHGLGIPTPTFGIAKNIQQATDIAKNIGFPLSIKPNAEGSSIGITRVVCLEELAFAFNKASQYGDVMVEKWIDGRNLTVGIIGEEVLPSIEIRAPGTFYDYEAKYESEETQYFCPAPLSAAQETALRELAYRTFCALGCTGWGRVDLMQDEAGNFWVLEVNTIPGMTSHSLIPMAAQVAGLNFDETVLAILETTRTVPMIKSSEAELAQV